MSKRADPYADIVWIDAPKALVRCANEWKH